MMTDDICENRHGGNPESAAAFQHIQASAENLRGRMLLYIRENPGETCEEIARALNIRRLSTASARISEMKRDGEIVKSGTSRTTTGCTAAIYDAA